MELFDYINQYEKLRDSIQEYDEKILSLLEKRMDLAKELIYLKRKNGNDVYMPIIEKNKIEKLSKNCKYPGLVELIWPVIMCYARTKE